MDDQTAGEFDRVMEQFSREISRLQRQVLYLFALIVVALCVLAFRSQINDNRIELVTWQICTQVNTQIEAFNAVHSDIDDLPLPECGQDPRTD